MMADGKALPPVAQRNPVVPVESPAALRLPIFPVDSTSARPGSTS